MELDKWCNAVSKDIECLTRRKDTKKSPPRYQEVDQRQYPSNFSLASLTMIDLPFTQLKHLFDSSNGFINCASDMQDPWFRVVLVGTCRYQFWRYGSARCLGGRVSARCVNTRITHGLARLVASLTRYSGCTQMVGKKTTLFWLGQCLMALFFPDGNPVLIWHNPSLPKTWWDDGRWCQGNPQQIPLQQGQRLGEL